ncbi:MAG: hypothetical protein VX835_02390 [Pseudomonadota bacterium]|nr:hypothetical protein [Pseudomonadota bacterium]
MNKQTQLDTTFQPESITFLTTLSACINTLYFISALGMGIFSVSVIGITYLVLVSFIVIGISLFVSWIEKKNHDNQNIQFKILQNIKDKKLKDLVFPKKILDNLNAMSETYSWRLYMLLFMCIIADILVFSTLLSTFTFFIFGPALLQEFAFQLFLICFSTVISLILCCFRSYNYDIIINNRNKIKHFAIDIIADKTSPNCSIKAQQLTNSEFFIGILLGVITTLILFFLINHLLLLSQTNIFSLKLIHLITMIESYIHGYSLLASTVVGFIVYRIYCSFKLNNPDWQLINSFINVISTYVIVIIFSQRFIILFVTLFSIPIAGPQIALANFLIPVIASVISIFHAYSFFTFYSDERELNLNVDEIQRHLPSDCLIHDKGFTNKEPSVNLDGTNENISEKGNTL